MGDVLDLEPGTRGCGTPLVGMRDGGDRDGLQALLWGHGGDNWPGTGGYWGILA